MNKTEFFKSNKPVIIPVEDMAGFFAKQLSALEFSSAMKLDGIEQSIFCILCSICDEQGNRIFEDSDKQELESLPYEVVNKLALGALKANANTLEKKA
jgi:hypothetical protein